MTNRADAERDAAQDKADRIVEDIWQSIQSSLDLVLHYGHGRGVAYLVAHDLIRELETWIEENT